MIIDHWKEFCTEHEFHGPIHTSRELDLEEVISKLYEYSCRLEDRIEELELKCIGK